MSTLYLHIGSHKTGSTSIQMACRHALAKRGRKGAHYINIRPSGTRILRTRGLGEDFVTDINQKAAARVLQPQGRAGAIHIASDEELFWIDRPEPVARLARMLRDRFQQIRIICYLRRQDQLALAHRKQVLEGSPATRFYGVDATPLPVYRPHFQRYFDYAGKLDRIWCSAFGKENVTVIPFERPRLVDQDVVADFAHRLGIAFSGQPIRANESLAGNKTFLGLVLAGTDLPRARRREILGRLKGRGQFLPTQHEARAFVANFAEANERLAAEWQWNGAPLRFDDSFAMYPEVAEYRQWETAEVQEMLLAMLPDMLATSAKATAEGGNDPVS